MLGCIAHVCSRAPDNRFRRTIANIGLESAGTTAAEEHDEANERSAEAHSGCDQMDNIDRSNSREAGSADDARQAEESK
jgi:hypothetical protein